MSTAKNFKVNIQKIFLFFLWVYLCFNVGDSGLKQPCNSATLPRVQIPVQLGSILVKIIKQVLATVTIKYHQSRLRGLMKGIICLDAGSGKVLRQ